MNGRLENAQCNVEVAAGEVDLDARSQKVVAAEVGASEQEDPTMEVKETEKGAKDISDA